MKSSSTTYILFILFVLITSCSDVVEADLPTTEPVLVVEASIDWQKGTPGNNQSIKLSTTTPYYENQQPSPVVGAIVKITNNNNGAEFIFEDQNNGIYTTTNFIPILNQSYTLHIFYEEEEYSATETLVPVTEIEQITQSIEGGFDDEIRELNLYFQDPENQENYNFLKYYRQGDNFPYLEVYSDEFTNGSRVEHTLEIDDDEDSDIEPLAPGDVVEIYFYGISERYYNYMQLLLSQSEGGGPFSSVPVALHGNCVNINNPEEDVYGYFRLSEMDKEVYTVN